MESGLEAKLRYKMFYNQSIQQVIKSEPEGTFIKV